MKTPIDLRTPKAQRVKLTSGSIDMAMKVFDLRLRVAKFSYALAIALAIASPVLTAVTGHSYFLYGDLGAGSAYTSAHLNMRAAQKIACPDSS